MPSTIASGEVVTIPSGRVVVHPNLQVDSGGTLDISGDLFVPAGGSVSDTTVNTHTLNMTGVGARITGDFSNATVTNRTAFQTSTTNGTTGIPIVPNGTATASNIQTFNSSDTTNASQGYFSTSATEVSLVSNKLGTGAYLPMTFYTTGAERLRIDASGNIGIGTSSPATTLGKLLHIYNSTNDGTPNSNSSLKLESINRNSAILLYGDINTISSFKPDGTIGGSLLMQSSTSIQLFTNSNGLGYGGGSGGTVTQVVSKSESVTLNKPSGEITTHNASLASGSSVSFIVFNALVTTIDAVSAVGIWGATDPRNYDIKCNLVGSGLFNIKITNISGGALVEALRIRFTVFKGAIA